MMDRTDRHYRYFMRQITRHTLLYTEMITTAALLHGDRDRLLGFSDVEKPLVLQLGGDDPGTWRRVLAWLQTGAMMRSISMSAALATASSTVILAPA